MVHGKGFVKLGEWLAERHSCYVYFMGRVQKMIAAVTLAEKELRKHAAECQKAVLGYDPTKWQKQMRQSEITMSKTTLSKD